jgi:hypothetical protein
MTRRFLLITCSLIAFCADGAKAGVVGIVNLNAMQVGQAAPFGSNPVNVSLGPGTYIVTPVGIAGGGMFDAWSAWPANSGCQPNHICTIGWETSFDYSYSGGYFNAGNTTKYDTPSEALAHAVSASFTLAATETVSFGFNECAPCLGDNRGGNSLRIEAVSTPEPTSVSIVIIGLVGLAVKLLRGGVWKMQPGLYRRRS